MLWFPQLESGANGQFPTLRRIVYRTRETEQADGSLVRSDDPGAAEIEWELPLSGLTGSEVSSIEALFVAVEGRLGAFTFLDPMDNLLRWSEDPAQEAWVKTAAVEPGGADPLGGTASIRIGSGGEIRQTVQAPAGLVYCFSAYVRDGEAELIARAGAEESGKGFAAGAAWVRVDHTLRLNSADESVTFAVRGSAELFGMQVDAQAGASAYKATGSRSGVYNRARFAEDVLGIATEGPDSHSCRVRIRSALD